MSPAGAGWLLDGLGACLKHGIRDRHKSATCFRLPLSNAGRPDQHPGRDIQCDRMQSRDTAEAISLDSAPTETVISHVWPCPDAHAGEPIGGC
eukprot:42742-Eustigmatos_ZCMA.PRE.1